MNQSLLREYAFAYQPILGINQSTVAAELFYRRPEAQQADVIDNTAATAEVIVNAFIHEGLDSLLGSRKVFVNVGEDMLLSDMLMMLPREQVTIELLETNPINRQVLERCHKLKAMGYCIALDDFECSQIDAYSPLLKTVDIVKIDLMVNERAMLPEAVARLKRWRVKLLAEKVETIDDFEFCRKLGFNLFQGYYFARPTILSGKRPDPSKMALLDLLGKLNRNASDSIVVEAFKRNASLSFHMLRLVNSAALGMGTRVSSLRQVLLLLGRRQLSRWLQVLLFTLSEDAPHSSPLFELAAKRGKLMELLAQDDKVSLAVSQEHAFMVGMLSLADTLLGMPMPGIMAHLGVANEIGDALLERNGTLGRMLVLCEKLEAADFVGVEEMAEMLGIPLASIMASQNAAISWVNKLNYECC